MFKAPAIYFPTTVVLLDDDRLYAKMLINHLGVSGIKHFEYFDFLLDQKSNDFLFSDVDGLRNSHHLSEIDYIKSNLNTLKKTGSLISVVASDLHMEKTSGLDVLSAIASSYIGRILISNFLDYRGHNNMFEATHADTVDIYLDKTSNFNHAFVLAIKAAKNKFFTMLSNALFPTESKESPLSDNEFAKFFLAKINELNPQEIKTNASFNRFEFLTAGEENRVIHVTHHNEIQENLSSLAAETAPKELLPHLASGKYMLCHDDNESILPEGNTWPLFIRPAKPFHGTHVKYFYSIHEVNGDNRASF